MWTFIYLAVGLVALLFVISCWRLAADLPQMIVSASITVFASVSMYAVGDWIWQNGDFEYLKAVASVVITSLLVFLGMAITFGQFTREEIVKRCCTLLLFAITIVLVNKGIWA